MPYSGTTEEIVNSLNDAARGFFGMVQSSWWEELLLHLCRMTDDRHDVLSVHRMVKLVKPAIRDRSEELLNIAEERVAFAREWRDEYIAHRSLERAINANVTRLPPASRNDVLCRSSRDETTQAALKHTASRVRP